MYVLILYLCLLPSQNVDSLIQDLGNESYSVRADSAKKLLEIGYPAHTKLKEAYLSEDMDISQASKMIVWAYYKPLREPICSIWMTPREFRFINGEDIAETYYKIAIAKKVADKDDEIIVPTYYEYDDAQHRATFLMFEEMLNEGRSNEVEILHKRMCMMHHTFDSISYPWHEPYSPPEAVEDRIWKSYLMPKKK